MERKLKGYADLMRLHFFFVWPILFCSGLFLALQHYGEFSWLLVAKAAFIGFFGFEAGLVLNDIVDCDIDKKEIEFDKLTKYWRVFGSRPISQGLVSRQRALLLFGGLVISASALIFTLPFPHSLYVFSIMMVCYCLEVFYQVKKRSQSFPISQLIGRIDFTLFPVAGYLALGILDVNAFLFALFFYPLAQAHLGVNDLADVTNDRAKNLKTIPMMYGLKNTAYWILLFTAIHLVAITFFLSALNSLAIIGFVFGFSLIATGNFIILKGKNAAAMKALPLFHLAMLTYAISIILAYII
jgi:4-hydroxybenzoate polyprenyltransferase